MAITLGSYVFDEQRTTVKEYYEEVGGRDGRVVLIEGVFDRAASLATLEGYLDSLLANASEAAPYLSLRAGRRMKVQRNSFEREVNRQGGAGRYALRLEVSPPYEEAETESTLAWNVDHSGASVAINPGGNRESLPRISITATQALVDPVLSDGVRSLHYAGEIAAGEVLCIDAATGGVSLEGEEVSPYTTGYFPRLSPAGSQLTYSDAEESSHLASISIAYRSRWW